MEGAVDTLVPDDVANQLVAATREALSNVARHAHATKVDVHMEIRGDEVVLEVIDDGVGIREGGRSSGLRNLRARAAGCRRLVRDLARRSPTAPAPASPSKPTSAEPHRRRPYESRTPASPRAYANESRLYAYRTTIARNLVAVRRGLSRRAT